MLQITKETERAEHVLNTILIVGLAVMSALSTLVVLL